MSRGVLPLIHAHLHIYLPIVLILRTHLRHCPTTWSESIISGWAQSRFQHYAAQNSAIKSRLERFNAVRNFANENCYDEKLGAYRPCANMREYIKKKYRKEEVYSFFEVGCFQACPANNTVPAVGETWECTLSE